MTQNNFCAEPWKQIFIGPDSKVKTCCAGRTNLGDLKEQNIEEILKNSPLKEIKESILNGEWHQNCGLCKELEEKGVNSQRKRTEHEFKNIEFYKNNVDSHEPEVLDIRWSNTCNLACNYCFPYFSSVWASIKNEYQTAPRNYGNVITYVKDNIDKVKSIWLLGGEPFLQKDNLELLKILPQDVEIVIVTNLTTDIENNPMFSTLLEKTKLPFKINFCLSFETVGEKFEYVRHNGSWEKFNYNLSLIKKNFSGRIIAFPLYCVYSAFNLEEYYDFVVENKLAVQWQKIEGPWQLNVSLLPEEYRKKAIEEIEKVYNKYYDPNNPDRSLGILYKNGEPCLDLGTLLRIKESLKLPGTHEHGEINLNLQNIIEFHEELETKYHNKKNKFIDLWKTQLDM